MNKGLYTFLISLVLFLILVDPKRLKINIYGGVLSAIYRLIEDVLANKYDLWKYHGVNDHLPNWVIFTNTINVFAIGIAFTMGILFFQLLPNNLYLQLLHASIWVLLYFLLKYLDLSFNLMQYDFFRIYMMTHTLIFLLTIAWFKNNFLNRGKCQVA